MTKSNNYLFVVMFLLPYLWRNLGIRDTCCIRGRYESLISCISARRDLLPPLTGGRRPLTFVEDNEGSSERSERGLGYLPL